jgi:hypothetical protein
LALLE